MKRKTTQSPLQDSAAVRAPEDPVQPSVDPVEKRQLPQTWKQAKGYLLGDEGTRAKRELEISARNHVCHEVIVAWHAVEEIKALVAENRGQDALKGALARLLALKGPVKGLTDYPVNLSPGVWRQLETAQADPIRMHVAQALTAATTRLDNMLEGVWDNYLKDVAAGKFPDGE